MRGQRIANGAIYKTTSRGGVLAGSPAPHHSGPAERVKGAYGVTA